MYRRLLVVLACMASLSIMHAETTQTAEQKKGSDMSETKTTNDMP
jgi:hypothetical protein